MSERKPLPAAVEAGRSDAARRKAANVRTAIVLFSIAAAFFVGVIASHLFGVDGPGTAVLGAAILVYLAFAIGRNLRRERQR